MDSSDIVIMPKPDSISWEEITELLHLAFASHLENGLNYAACTQTEEETRQRVGDGMCMVALINGELVGTATLNFYRGVAHLGQVAVHPDFRKYGIGRKLQAYILEDARNRKLSALVCDTSERATEIVAWYLRTGWQKVGLASGQTTNYYSIVFRKPVCGRRYTALEAGIRFYLSSCFWRLMLTEHGKIRKLSKPFYLLARKIYRIVR